MKIYNDYGINHLLTEDAWVALIACLMIERRLILIIYFDLNFHAHGCTIGHGGFFEHQASISPIDPCSSYRE